VANGVAAQLANLSTAQNTNLNNLSFTDYYSSIASGIGQAESTASANQTTQAQLLSQAQNMRSQVEGVSLNQQASLLMQYQQSYQAAAQMISTVNTTMQSLLTVMQQVSG
jgi:flagellar hook-associated protein 1 FlgK